MIYFVRSKLSKESSSLDRDKSFGCTVQRNINANSNKWKVALMFMTEHEGLLYYKICGTNGVEIHPGRTIVIYSDHGCKSGPQGFHFASGARSLVDNILHVLQGGVDWILFFVCQLSPWINSNKGILNLLSYNRQLHIDYNSVQFGAAQIADSLSNLITRPPYYHILEKQITMTPGEEVVYYPKPNSNIHLPSLNAQRR